MLSADLWPTRVSNALSWSQLNFVSFKGSISILRQFYLNQTYWDNLYIWSKKQYHVRDDVLYSMVVEILHELLHVPSNALDNKLKT